MSSNIVQQFNGTVTTAPTTLSWAQRCDSVLVQKVDSSANSLLVSFDGILYKTLANQWDWISVDSNLLEILVKSSAGTADYEVVVAL